MKNSRLKHEINRRPGVEIGKIPLHSLHIGGFLLVTRPNTVSYQIYGASWASEFFIISLRLSVDLNFSISKNNAIWMAPDGKFTILHIDVGLCESENSTIIALKIVYDSIFRISTKISRIFTFHAGSLKECRQARTNHYEPGGHVEKVGNEPDEPGSHAGAIENKPGNPGNHVEEVEPQPKEPGSYVDAVENEPEDPGGQADTVGNEPGNPVSGVDTVGNEPGDHGSLVGAIGGKPEEPGSHVEKVGNSLDVMEGFVNRKILK
jgi:hypothetical protein